MPDLAVLKSKIYEHYKEQVRLKIAELQQKLDDLQESLKQETKSTAGDKYETARAMVHIEQENTGRQLANLQAQKADLDNIDISMHQDHVTKGSLVATDQHYFFISVAQGKAVIEGQVVYALSPQSPLGIKLMNGRKGNTVTLNGHTYAIEHIA